MPNDIGMSVYCPGAGANCNLGTINGLYAKTNGIWAMAFVIYFDDDNSNTFFGNAGAGSRVFYLKRNPDGTLHIQIIDASGDKREVTWASVIKYKTWYKISIESSGPGADNLKMFVGTAEQEISAQTHDAGFEPETNFDLRFGEAESGVTGAFFVSRMYFYEIALTAADRANIVMDRYPTGYSAAFRCDAPNIGPDSNF